MYTLYRCHPGSSFRDGISIDHWELASRKCVSHSFGNPFPLFIMVSLVLPDQINHTPTDRELGTRTIYIWMLWIEYMWTWIGCQDQSLAVLVVVFVGVVWVKSVALLIFYWSTNTEHVCELWSSSYRATVFSTLKLPVLYCRSSSTIQVRSSYCSTDLVWMQKYKEVWHWGWISSSLVVRTTMITIVVALYITNHLKLALAP